MKSTSLLVLALAFTASAASTHWVATWGASPAPQMADEKQMATAKLLNENQTLREIVHTSIGGDTVRIRLSNAYGKQQLDIGSVHIALRAQGAAITPASDHPVTFSGRAAVSIPANALVLSDPIKLTAPDAADLAISIFIPKATQGAGIHYSASQTRLHRRGRSDRCRSHHRSH